MDVTPITLDDEPIDLATDYETRFGRVILAYVMPNTFLTNHGRMSTDQLVQDATKIYRGRDINPIAIVGAIAQAFLESDHDAELNEDVKLAEDCKDILFWSLFGDDPAELLEGVRRSRWHRESTSRLFARLSSYSDEEYDRYREDIDAIKKELARRNVTEASWGRRAPPISFD